MRTVDKNGAARYTVKVNDQDNGCDRANGGQTAPEREPFRCKVPAFLPPHATLEPPVMSRTYRGVNALKAAASRPGNRNLGGTTEILVAFVPVWGRGLFFFLGQSGDYRIRRFAHNTCRGVMNDAMDRFE